MNRRERRERARETAQRAAALRQTALQDASPQRVLEASHRLFEMGKLRDALPALRKAVGAHPRDMRLRAALAYALGGSGEVGAAILQYREMLAIEPEAVPIMTNLAILLARIDKTDEARDLLQRASELAPEHANTAYSLAELLDRLGRKEEAFAQFRRAAALYDRQIGLDADPGRCNDLIKLASAQFWIGDIAGALRNFDRAVALRPDHPLALARRGLALAKLGRKQAAIESLRQAAATEPGYAEVRRALGDILLEVGDRENARRYYQAALRINPKDELAAYFLATTEGGRAPDAPPPRYVAQLFDEYAQKFEHHLVDVLQYRAPQLLCEALLKVASPSEGAWDVIDLGCGTGLCGPLLRPYARSMIGVDLSAGMLEKAKEKGVYDELVQADLVAALDQLPAAIDAAVSADVFVYIGNLQPVFDAATRALRPGGWFAFTTEAGEGDSYDLPKTGRYRHARSYVERCAASCGLTVVHYEQIVGRYEQLQPVMQNLHVLRLVR